MHVWYLIPTMMHLKCYIQQWHFLRTGNSFSYWIQTVVNEKIPGLSVMFLSLTGSLSSPIYNVPVSASVSFCISPVLCHESSPIYSVSEPSPVSVCISPAVYLIPSTTHHYPSVYVCVWLVCALSRPQRICVCLFMSVCDLSAPSPIYSVSGLSVFVCVWPVYALSRLQQRGGGGS